MARLKVSQIFVGIYSVPDTANMVGVKYETFRYWIKNGWVEAPAVPVGKRLCYSEEQIERLSERLKDFQP